VSKRGDAEDILRLAEDARAQMSAEFAPHKEEFVKGCRQMAARWKHEARIEDFEKGKGE
jgi:hypothetical protein